MSAKVTPLEKLRALLLASENMEGAAIRLLPTLIDDAIEWADDQKRQLDMLEEAINSPDYERIIVEAMYLYHDVPEIKARVDTLSKVDDALEYIAASRKFIAILLGKTSDQ